MIQDLCNMKDCSSQTIAYVLFAVSGFGFGVIACLLFYALWKFIKKRRQRYNPLNGDREYLVDELQRVTKERDSARKEASDAIKEKDDAQRETLNVIKERDDARTQAFIAIKERDDARKQAFNAIKERDDANLRLSEIMSVNLRDGNPNIADLSDENRPTKLSEKLLELYDNEYTDAMSLLHENHITETEVIRLLLDILGFAYESCANASEKQLAIIDQLVRLPATVLPDLDTSDGQTRPVLSKEILKRFKDERKAIKPDLSSILKQVVLRIKAQYNDVHFLDRTPVTTYINNCTELAWRMTVQDPPMFLEFNENRLENLRAFTRSGPELDFHVWPTLYQYKGGPIMTKGVAQFK